MRANRSAVIVAGSSLRSSKTAAPRIAGTAISRLNPTAHARVKPRPSAVAIVSPLRLTPGKGANACAIPTISACTQVVRSGPRVPPFRRVVRSSTDAVMRNPTPTAVRLWKARSIQGLKISASGTSGSVATIASRPTRTTSGRRNPSGTSASPARPRRPSRTCPR